MLKKKKPVLDEREMLELYRVEHFGLWLMYGLLCAALLAQLIAGAEMEQMAGELAVVIVASVAMMVQHVRRGIWDENSRPSVRGNAAYSLGAGVCVAVLLTVLRGKLAAALIAGVIAAALCFAALTLLMRCMLHRQEKEAKELDNE